jgi:hypothetical protein
LENQFYSIEADIWLKEGEIVVAHDWGDFKGSLKDLYLDPLQARVDEKGSVHGDSLEFYLWIDIKDGKAELLNTLHDLLKQYSMLTMYEDDDPSYKSVNIILTGNAEQKTNYVNRFNPRYACRDSNSFNKTDPHASTKWPWYALNWNSHFEWSENSPMPEETMKALKIKVDTIHDKGRRVRFYATPDNRHYWKAALETGVDLINTDRLTDLHEFLQSQENN